ncbi:hypothetical protein BpHYR1_040392 [Brachionus plicatilis]|uniref:Uncharacterized protein n=1 Tax=Brachionus plicatilis TaxID=10195 RepID=A0A3M7RB87_BRAPC|nr:hypothetical protein BpHYR1_040392 [Brachionus plicatilis]
MHDLFFLLINTFNIFIKSIKILNDQRRQKISFDPSLMTKLSVTLSYLIGFSLFFDREEFFVFNDLICDMEFLGTIKSGSLYT